MRPAGGLCGDFMAMAASLIAAERMLETWLTVLFTPALLVVQWPMNFFSCASNAAVSLFSSSWIALRSCVPALRLCSAASASFWMASACFLLFS